jgi:hypothetical protein
MQTALELQTKAKGDDAGGGGGDEGNEGNEELTNASRRTPLPPPVKRYRFQDLPIAIENPQGSLRLWTEAGPNSKVIGSTKMLHDYGFIEGHLSGDDEELDCYVGPDEAAPNVYVVHQGLAPDFKKHDEDKVFLGFPSADAARAAYVAHRNDGDRALRGMSCIPLDVFRKRLKTRSATSTGKIRATALVTPEERERRRFDTVVALTRLAQAGGTRRVALRNGRRPRETYTDGLTSNARQLAARALAVDVSAVKEVIDQLEPGPGWPERLKTKLLTRFRGMKPEQFALVMQKARLMAHMAGRVSAIEEV